MTKKMISARIPVSINIQLEQMAKRERRSKSFLVEEALQNYVAREAWILGKMEASLTEADQADEWISNDAALAWLESWGTEKELPPPKPDLRVKKVAA